MLSQVVSLYLLSLAVKYKILVESAGNVSRQLTLSGLARSAASSTVFMSSAVVPECIPSTVILPIHCVAQCLCAEEELLWCKNLCLSNTTHVSRSSSAMLVLSALRCSPILLIQIGQCDDRVCSIGLCQSMLTSHCL